MIKFERYKVKRKTKEIFVVIIYFIILTAILYGLKYLL